MIGDLRHRVTLQYVTRVADGGGGFTETWHDMAADPVVYADIVPLSGGEQLLDRQLAATVTHRLTLRHRSDITTAMRAVKGSIIYDIVSVIDRGGRGIYLDVLARERRP